MAKTVSHYPKTGSPSERLPSDIDQRNVQEIGKTLVDTETLQEVEPTQKEETTPQSLERAERVDDLLKGRAGEDEGEETADEGDEDLRSVKIGDLPSRLEGKTVQELKRARTAEKRGPNRVGAISAYDAAIEAAEATE